MSKPAGTVENDVMVAVLQIFPGEGHVISGVDFGTDWTVFETFQEEPTNNPFLLAVGIKRAGASEPASYTATWTKSGGADWRVGYIATYTEVRTTGDPYDVAPAFSAPAAATDKPKSPSITTVTAGDRLLWIGANDNGASYTAPTGYTERIDNETTLADAEEVAAGPTGEIEGTSAESRNHVVGLIALPPEAEEEPEPEEPAASSDLRIFERPPMRQHLLATTPSGRVERWGEDELDPANVIEGLTDSGSVPGGDKTIEGSLPRKPGVDYADMKGGTKVQLFGAGGRLLRECRLERSPRTSGDHLTMDPAAMGYQVLLTDKEEASGAFLGADLSEWSGPSTTRRLNQSKGGSPVQQDAAVTPDDAGQAALHMEVQGEWATGITPICEGWFEGGTSIGVSRILGNWINGSADTKFELHVGFADDDAGALEERSGDLYTSTTGGFAWSAAFPWRRAFVYWTYDSSPAGVDGASFSVDLVNLR
jgi:hypothetical protein